MSNTSATSKQGDVLLPSSRCIKPCCEAEIKLKILSRAIRKKSSIEQLTLLLECLVETKNGHDEMSPSGYHARFKLAQGQGKLNNHAKLPKEPEIKKEPKMRSDIGSVQTAGTQ